MPHSIYTFTRNQTEPTDLADPVEAVLFKPLVVQRQGRPGDVERLPGVLPLLRVGYPQPLGAGQVPPALEVRGPLALGAQLAVEGPGGPQAPVLQQRPLGGRHRHPLLHLERRHDVGDFAGRPVLGLQAGQQLLELQPEVLGRDHVHVHDEDVARLHVVDGQVPQHVVRVLDAFYGVVGERAALAGRCRRLRAGQSRLGGFGRGA